MGLRAATRIPDLSRSAQRLLAALALLAAGCGGGGAGAPAMQYQAGALFRSGDMYNYSGPHAADAASREALQYTLSGVVYYLVDYPASELEEGGFYVSSAWNGQLDTAGETDQRPPDGQIAIAGDTARAVIELGGGPDQAGLRLTGSFSVAACNSATAQARAALQPSTFPGMDPQGSFLRGRGSTPLIVTWRAEGQYGQTAVDISAQQTLAAEAYEYTLTSPGLGRLQP